MSFRKKQKISAEEIDITLDADQKLTLYELVPKFKECLQNILNGEKQCSNCFAWRKNGDHDGVGFGYSCYKRDKSKVDIIYDRRTWDDKTLKPYILKTNIKSRKNVTLDFKNLEEITLLVKNWNSFLKYLVEGKNEIPNLMTFQVDLNKLNTIDHSNLLSLIEKCRFEENICL